MRPIRGSHRQRRGRIPTGVGVLVWAGVAVLLWAGAAAFASANSGQHVAALPGEAARALRGLSVSHDADQLLIRVDVDTPVRYTDAMLSDPARYVLDLYGVEARGQPQSDFPVEYGPVQSVHIAERSGDARHVQVVVILREATPCVAGAAADGKGLVIVVGRRGLGALAAAPDRPSVGGPRLALPRSGLTGALWSGFMRAVQAEPTVLPAEDAPPVAATAHLAATSDVAATQADPLITRVAAGLTPALAEEAASGPRLPVGERTAGVRTAEPVWQLLVSATAPPAEAEPSVTPAAIRMRPTMAGVATASARLPAGERTSGARPSEPSTRLPVPRPGEGSVVTPASYSPLMSDTPRLPRTTAVRGFPARATLASLPNVKLPEPSLTVARVPVPSAVSTAGATITSLWQAPSAEGFELRIETSADVDFHTERLTHPTRYVLHLPETTVTDECERQLDVPEGAVERVQLVPSDEETTVNMVLRGPAECTSYRLPGKTTLVATVKPSEIARMAASAGMRAEGAAGGDLIELHFYQADLTAVLVAFGQYSEKSIVASSSVQGTITVDLSGVSFQTALDIVTKLQGYDYVLLGERTYVVGTAEELAKLVPLEQVVAERGRVITYTPNYVTPDDIAEFFSQIADDLGIEVSAARGLNVVIFKGIRNDAVEQEIQSQLKLVDKELPPITTLYTLKYLRPDAAQKALGSYVPEATVQTAGADVPTQVIQLRGSPAVLAHAEEVLNTLDVAPQAMPPLADELVTEMVVIDHQDPEEVQVTLSSLFPENLEVYVHTGGGSLGELNLEGIREAGLMRRTGLLVLRGERSVVAEARAVIKQIDVPLPRVQISASIIEVSYSRNAVVGLIWSLPGIVFNEAAPHEGFRFGTFTRDPWTFSSILQAVDTKSTTRILSNPKIVVESTKRGSILVGEVIPFETTVPGEGTVTRSLNFQEVGLGVDFTPVVKSDGSIEMYMKPHVSNFGEFTPSGFPRISTRETETIVSARDGDTIIIGGLLQEQDLISTSGIPFFQEFPLVGDLFKQRTKSRQKTEIVVMATIEIVEYGAPSASALSRAVVPPA